MSMDLPLLVGSAFEEHMAYGINEKKDAPFVKAVLVRGGRSSCAFHVR
jgi:hypothetical protein